MKQTDYTKQAQDFLYKTGATVKVKYQTHDFYFPDDKDRRDIYRVALKRQGVGSYTFSFGQSTHHSTADRQEPTAYDILACLTKSDPGTLEDFCSDFGYDVFEDRRQSFKTYNAVQKEYNNLARLFSEDELGEMQEIS